MKRLSTLLIGAVLGIMLGAAATSMAAISSFGGAQDPSQLFNYLNALISVLNNEVTNYLVFQNASEPGEMQITGTSTAFAHNGSIATAMTSIGPVGSHTTVQEWLIVVDPSGYIRYIPCF